MADALIHDCRPAAGEDPFVQLDGPQTDRIRLWNNDLSRVNEKVSRSDNMDKAAEVDVR